MNSPHSAVPQNFQIRGGRCGGDGERADFGIEGIHQTDFQANERHGSARSSRPVTSALARSTAPYMLA